MTTTECCHGIIPMACTVCNGRDKPSRPASSHCYGFSRRRQQVGVPSIKPSDVLGDLPAGWAALAASDEKLGKTAPCAVCPSKGISVTKRVWTETERFPHGIWVPKVNPSTHRVKGRPICDECCRDGCSRCRTMEVPRHYASKKERLRAERASQSVFAVATGHSGVAS